ncbi:hypothetical protein ZHAS_00012373 [Anopheles sinensis]|uniref:Uncharacterized protein n=1 Tax=Anopheles sinensis TaxID=74873 RepID=A0A084W2Q3_ANOSI|nr:hypothetical protein ZHAS_00012373 [Anopheles sinensis]
MVTARSHGKELLEAIHGVLWHPSGATDFIFHGSIFDAVPRDSPQNPAKDPTKDP